MLEAVERRVERTLLDLERAARDLPDAQQHGVAVQLAERDRLEDEEVEGAREKSRLARLVGHHRLLCWLGEQCRRLS
jgi:hypothetical protein